MATGHSGIIELRDLGFRIKGLRFWSVSRGCVLGDCRVLGDANTLLHMSLSRLPRHLKPSRKFETGGTLYGTFIMLNTDCLGQNVARYFWFSLGV